MRTAYDLVTWNRTRPDAVAQSARRYSRHATPVLRFFARHRTALAAHVQREFPCLFHTDRGTRMHLQTLVAARDLEPWFGRGPGQQTVYLLTANGLHSLRQRARSEGDESHVSKVSVEGH